MKIGDLVAHRRPRELCSGAAVYPYAVVVSMDPFVLISERGDMLWQYQETKNFYVVGECDSTGLKLVLRRLGQELARSQDDVRYFQTREVDVRQDLAKFVKIVEKGSCNPALVAAAQEARMRWLAPEW